MREIFDRATQRVPITSWADEIEAGALEQALHLARLPFAFHHVAVMPDVHQGFGMPIGAVLAAEGHIIPHAVGVDIGCFTGDTLVPTLDGKAYTLAHLASRSQRGQEHYVWACTPGGRIVAAQATAHLTRRNAPLVKVTLDNGEAIRCTPDHPFMLRDSSYVEAQHLPPGASLMPFYAEADKDGYLLIQQPYSGRWQKTHRVVSRSAALAESGCGIHNHRRRVHSYNHAVVAVEALAEREDVYCLTVPDYHNFALAAGVFVHNCGMIARRTSLRVEQLQAAHPGQGTVLQAALGGIMRSVPVGLPPRGAHKTAQAWTPPAEFVDLIERAPEPLLKAWQQSAFQLGTLGSGNHFIEVQADADERVWLMLHSGSRALGKAVCDHFNAEADAFTRREHPEVPPSWGLAFLPADHPAGQAYSRWMHLCLAYAEQNRALMAERATEALASAAGGLEVEETIQTHHNYAALERHFGEDVWVHRKGACRARAGELMIIPGSMETGSYIGRGKGNPESFESCAHGAGRRLSRGAARRARTVQDMVQSMQRKGIALATHKVEGVLDEAGHAYKDVEAVMSRQPDLVEPLYQLRPLGVVKG